MRAPDNPNSPNAPRDIFLDALNYPAGEARSKFLDQACAGDGELRQAVEKLLRNHIADTFLETPAVNRAATPSGAGGDSTVRLAPEEAPGERVGPYKLLQQIGEGGCGVVYMAEQEEPIRRRVALKVIKLGMDTKSVIARFEAERQALAMMDHPYIARVLDAGATRTGRPYFVMDLVRGIKITEYCDQNQLSTQDRLELFIGVCQAIQHAHQKGIIHRDIKPSNVLVTLHDSEPVPRIIDFGVAKAIGQRLTDKTVFTEFQAFVGTPAYTSPEQAEMSGLDIDTRSDIYSLGVLLYEILTGVTPFDAEKLAASGLDQMRRTIREEEPVVPSTRIATMLDEQRTATARRRKCDAGRLEKILRGDLDWIVMKALEKDRTRRYATASELAQDVQHFLRSEPVTARPPSRIYRFQKFVRRNRMPFAAATAATTALVIGLAVAAWQFIEKNRAYQRVLTAEHEERQARLGESRLRHVAEEQELSARRKAYAADMNLVAQALAANNLGRARQLLDQHRPQAGQHDLRGWEWRYLWQHCQSDALFTLCRLTNQINSLAVSHDGRWAAIGEAEGGLTLWDLRTRQEFARLPASPGSVIAAFSPAAPLLAFASGGRFGPRTSRGPSVQIWDGNEKRISLELTLDGRCEALIFSRDGEKLLTATGNGLAVWNVLDGTQLSTLAAPGLAGFSTGLAVAATDDLSLVAYPLAGGKIRLADLKRGAELWSAEAAEEQVTALRFSPDGRLLVSGAGFVESAIRLWEVESGTLIGRLEGHRTWITSLLFWPDGQTLASASGDQTIRLWDLSGAQPQTARPFRRPHGRGRPEPGARFRELSVLRGHQFEVWAIALLPDQKTLLSASKDGTVSVWDTTISKREHSRLILPVEARTWQFSPDSQALVILDEDGDLIRREGPDFQQETALMQLPASRHRGILSPGARWLARPGTNDAIQVWNLDQRALVHEIPARAVPPSLRFLSRGNDAFLLWREFSPESGFPVRIIDVESGQPAHPWGAEFPPVKDSEVAFFLQGGLLLSASFDNGGTLRNLKAGTQRDFTFATRQVFDLAFAPNARFFAAISRAGDCELWDSGSVRRLVTLRGFLQGMHSLSFSPDSQRLAIGGNGSEAVKIWDVESFQEMLTLEGEGSIFHSLAFSPDGNRLAAANREGALHIWSAPSFADIQTMEARLR